LAPKKSAKRFCKPFFAGHFRAQKNIKENIFKVKWQRKRKGKTEKEREKHAVYATQKYL
jgi:hypothetical protein